MCLGGYLSYTYPFFFLLSSFTSGILEALLLSASALTIIIVIDPLIATKLLFTRGYSLLTCLSGIAIAILVFKINISIIF
jgi:hypothetical protein